MTLINKITSSWYDTAFTVSDDANIFENYNYASANSDGVLQSIYRYFQDHERRRNLNCIYGGFQTSLADSDTDLVIDISGTEDAEAMIAGRIVTMASAETMLVENGSLFPADDTYYICLQLSTITETSTRDGSSGETFSWVALTSLSAIDDNYLVVCSVDVSSTQTLFSNLVQLAYPYEVEANKFRPKYDHSMSFYVGDGDSQSRTLSILMDYADTTFYLPIKIDTIDEESTGVGVTIEGMLIRDITKIKADTEILYVNTIDDYDAGTLTITPPTTIVGTLGVTGLITGTAGFSGTLTGNVTGDVTGNADTATTLETARTIAISGDVTGAGVSFDGSANITISGTVVGNDSHTHTISTITDLASGATGITKIGTIVTGVWGSLATPIANTSIAGIDQNLLQASSPTFVGVTATTFAGALTGNVTGNASGNAGTSTAWATGRTLILSGEVTGTSSVWDGSGNATLTATVVDDSHNHTLSTLNLAGATGITSVGTIVTGVWNGTSIDDANVDDDITLTNLTQITTRNHSDLFSIGTDDHHNKRTQNFTLINEIQTSHTKIGAGNQTWDDYDARMSFTNADIDYARIKGAWTVSAAGTSGGTTIQIRFQFPDTTNIVVDSKAYSSSGSNIEYFDYDLISYISKFINGLYKVQVYIINDDSNLEGTGQIHTVSLDIG